MKIHVRIDQVGNSKGDICGQRRGGARVRSSLFRKGGALCRGLVRSSRLICTPAQGISPCRLRSRRGATDFNLNSIWSIALGTVTACSAWDGISVFQASPDRRRREFLAIAIMTLISRNAISSLPGAEDLVPVQALTDEPSRKVVRYRPRTEGLFARILHHYEPGALRDFWEVKTKDGLVSY